MKKWLPALGALLLVVLVVRLALPSIAIRYVNGELAKLQDYSGSVSDLDIALWRGEYDLHQLVIEKRSGDVPEPLLRIEEVQLGLDWSAIFRGGIVADIEVFKPQLVFVDAPTSKNSQRGAGPDWTERVNALLPVTIDSFTINDGTIKLLKTDESGNPTEVAYVDQFTVNANNFSNVRDKTADVFGTLHITGRAQGKAQLELNAEMDPLADPPQITLDGSLEQLPLTSLNSLLRAYANVDAEAGTFSVYTEFASSDGRFEGYVKPLVKDAEILRLDEPGSFFGKAWESVVELAKDLLENEETDQVGSQIPLQGELTAVHAQLIPAIFSILRNAFIEALSAGIGNVISIDDVKENGNKSDAEKK